MLNFPEIQAFFNKSAMPDTLAAVLQSLYPFTPDELQQITPFFRKKAVAKNTVLLREGAVCKQFYFVVSGCVRLFFRDEKGSEKTRYVMLQNHIGTALSSFSSGKPSTESMEAVCDTELRWISREDFYRLLEEIPAWRSFYQRILEMAYAFQNRRIEQLTTQTARQRYAEVLNTQPQLIQHLSNRQLATYLDIREETLSRLKAANARF